MNRQLQTLSLALLGIALILGLGGHRSDANENETLSVDQIVQKTNLVAYYAGTDGRAQVKMTITNKEGKKRIREFTILRLDKEDGGEQKFYLYFKRPSDVRKMVYMVWKQIEKDDARWMYLPALDLVRRIAASDRRSSFVGSHFLYEDVSGRNPNEDTHELISTDKKIFIIKSLPKAPETVEFSYYTIKIDRKRFIPLLAEYYDKEGKKYRTVEALEIKNIQNYPTVTKAKVMDLISGGFTISEFSKIAYDTGIEEKIFTERFLRRPPRKWLK